MAPTSQAATAVAALASLALLAAGCVTDDAAPELLPPEVFLTGVAPVGGGLFEQRIRLTFRLTNPNAFDLAVDGFSFRLVMNGEPLARGVSGESLVVDALAERLVTAEASTTTLGLLHQLTRLSERRELAYDLSGRIHLSGAGVPWVAFERSARLGPSAAPAPQR